MPDTDTRPNARADGALAALEVPGPKVIQDPRPLYRALHAEAPVYKPPGHGFYIVSRYEDVKRVMGDTRTFSNGWYQLLTNPHPEVAAILAQGVPRKDVLPTADPPAHRRYRRLVDRVFSPARVQAMRPYINNLVSETIDAFIDDGRVEFMAAFAVKLPISIIADLLAVPRADIGNFKRWSDAALIPMSRTASLQARKAAAHLKLEMQRYVVAMLEDRRLQPRDDFPSALANATIEPETEGDEPRRLDAAEFIQIVESFIVAGNETTTNALGSGMLRLVNDPALMASLRAEPQLLAGFAEEILRLDAPIQGQPRVVTIDTELGGVRLAAGTLLDVRLGAANLDECQFADPGALCVHRQNAATHMSFGSGIHYCVGSALVRQELPIAFGALIDRLDNIRLENGTPQLRYIDSFMVRGLTELHLTFDRRAA